MSVITNTNHTRYAVRPSGVSRQTQYIFSILIISCGWMIFFANYANNFQILVSSSQGIRAYASSPGALITVGLFGSYAAILFSSWLLFSRLHVFLGLWLFSLAVSEAAIPILQPLMMFLRYIMMTALTVYGLLQFFQVVSNNWSGIQRLAFFMLLLLIVRLILGPSDPDAYLMMPMQITMFVGVFFGLPGRLLSESRLDSVGLAIVAVGAILTLINLFGLIFAPMPFEQGRFKSWYLLATGFANNYVLFLISMVWYLMFSKQAVLKCLCLAGVLVGSYLLILSGSRNALAVLAVAVFIMCAFWKPRYLFHIGAGLVLVLLLLYFMDMGSADLARTSARFSSISDHEVRFGVWSLAWSYIQSSFWLGYGLSASLRDLTAILPDWERFDSHNAYLGVWLRLGFFGLTIYLAIYFLAFRSGLKYLRRQRAQQKGVLVLFFSILCAVFLGGMFEENLSSRGSIQQGMWAVCAVLLTFIASRPIQNFRHGHVLI